VTELARVYAQIALLKRGPQDLPASLLLLAITVTAYFAVSLAVTSLLPALPGPWLSILLVDVVFTPGWYALLLRVLRRPERILQTTTAVFGYRAVLAPLSIVSGWLIRRFGEDALWQFPLAAVNAAIVVWMIAAKGHVLNAALEWSTVYCVALVILEILIGQLVLLALVTPAR